MADLSTKTLNELDTITEMGENDKVLVESNGRMKRCSGSLGGGGAVVLEVVQANPGSEGQHMVDISLTNLTNLLLSGQIPIFHFNKLSEYDYETYGSFAGLDIDQNSLYLFSGSSVASYLYDSENSIFKEYWD